MKILYLGTSVFSIPMLDNLHKNHEVVGVVTSHDFVNRGDVRKFSESNKLKVFEPLKLRDEQFLSEIKSLNADLFVVVAFKMLPEVLWKIPKLGTINLHASLLPAYRGATPINWAIINGEKKTGVTTFFIDENIDTGKIIRQDKIPIGNDETFDELHSRLMVLGTSCLAESIQNLEISKEQTGIVSYAPKINKSMCEINWNDPVDKVYNFIRGLSSPGSWTLLNGKMFKIFRCEKSLVSKNRLSFQCSDGFINVLECQLEGKKRMKADDFLRGYAF